MYIYISLESSYITYVYIHVYINEEWKRENIFIYLVVVAALMSEGFTNFYCHSSARTLAFISNDPNANEALFLDYKENDRAKNRRERGKKQ